MSAKYLIALLIAVALAGCGSQPTAAPVDTDATVQAAVAATLTAQPTNTATSEPTATPIPTETPKPTDTPEPTDTPTPANTPTPEPTNTDTPAPPTDTPEPTNTPVPPTNTPPPPTNTPAPPTATPVPPTPTFAPLPASAEMGIEKTIGAWSLKLYDLKRAKAVWFFGTGTYAQGVWLIPFVEFRNNSPGTLAPGDNLTFYFVDDQGHKFDFDVLNSDGILGAAHQFTTGHYYDPINPGLLLGISLPIDTPLETGPIWLRVEEDPNFLLYLGKASDVPLVDQ